MEAKEIKKRLKTLTRRELEVLNLMCQGLDYRQMAEELNITRRGVRTHTSNIGKKLELRSYDDEERARILRDQYCPEAKIGDFDFFEDEIEDEVEEKIQETLTPEEEAFVDKLEYALVRVEPITIQAPDIKENGGCFRRVRVLLGGLGLGILATLWLLNALDVIDIGGIISRDPTPTGAELADAAFEIDETAQSPEILPSETLPATLTDTAVPSPTNTQILPTNTSIPIPTNTPQPTAIPSKEILFEDDFEQALSPAWQVISGNPIVVNGMLSADQDTWLQIGDSSWKDYSVEFVAEADNCRILSSSNTLAIRVQNLDNMVAYKWGYCESYWYVVENGTWNEIPNSYFNPLDVATFRIVAQGEEFTVYVDGLKMSSFFDDSFESGRIALMIAEDTLIDNFRVIKE